MFKQPADLVYKMISLLQLCRPLARHRGLLSLDWFLASMQDRVAAMRRAARQSDID